jgi:mannose-6-phosphate isomerase-like protein (cupin superfamily)
MASLKVSRGEAARGDDGEVLLAKGQQVFLRLWDGEEPTDDKPLHRRDYEVVGYVISGRAELVMGGETVALEAGDSWVVPAGTEHTYRILQTFTALEAVAPAR